MSTIKLQCITAPQKSSKPKKSSAKLNNLIGTNYAVKKIIENKIQNKDLRLVELFSVLLQLPYHQDNQNFFKKLEFILDYLTFGK